MYILPRCLTEHAAPTVLVVTVSELIRIEIIIIIIFSDFASILSLIYSIELHAIEFKWIEFEVEETP